MPRSRRTTLAWAMVFSVALHGWVFYYPYFSLSHEESIDHSDVLSRHAGGKVPKVHIHLDNADALAGGHVLHIHWLTPKVSQPTAQALVQHSALHHVTIQRPRHHRVRKIANLNRRPELPADLPKEQPQVPSAVTVTALPTSPAAPLSSEVNTHKPDVAEVTEITANTHAIEVPKHLDQDNFPHDIRALYHIRVELAIPVGVDAMEHWQIDGHQYHLQLDAHKFGYHARIISQGLISEHGLAPAHFELSLNGKIKNIANFSYPDHLLQQGHPENLTTAPFDEGAQDMFSFAYHLAISFSGHDQLKLTVTNGNNLYNLMFTVVGEETLQLPAGTLRTLHLQGTRQAVGSSQVQSGFDAWLAPDFSNFPVKMSGPDSSGHLFVMAIKSLEFEGQPLFGQDIPAENSQDAAPPPADIQNIPDLQSATPSTKN